MFSNRPRKEGRQAERGPHSMLLPDLIKHLEQEKKERARIQQEMQTVSFLKNTLTFQQQKVPTTKFQQLLDHCSNLFGFHFFSL